MVVRRWLLLLVAVVWSVPGMFVGGAVHAGPLLDEAGEQLQRYPVYVDEQAERRISTSEAARLRAIIQRSRTPIFVAVLRESVVDEVDGDFDRLPEALYDATGFDGTYAVVTSEGFTANSNVVDDAGVVATAAFQARRDDGVAAVLEEFVVRVNQTQAAPGGAPAPAGDRGARTPVGAGDGGGGAATVVVLVLLVVGGGVLWFVASNRQRAARERAEASRREMLRAELSVLADDVMALEPQVVIHPDARDEYDAAVNRYKAAQAALDYADDAVDLVRVERVVNEARYAMARTRARIEGREPPPPPAELQEVGPHNEPPVELDEAQRPAYRGGGGWYDDGGWYRGGGDGGAIGALILGSILTGGWDTGSRRSRRRRGGGFGGFGGGGFGGGGFGGGGFGGGRRSGGGSFGGGGRRSGGSRSGGGRRFGKSGGGRW